MIKIWFKYNEYLWGNVPSISGYVKVVILDGNSAALMIFFKPASQRVHINLIFTENIRIWCLSGKFSVLTTNKSQMLLKILKKHKHMCPSNRFQWCPILSNYNIKYICTIYTRLYTCLTYIPRFAIREKVTLRLLKLLFREWVWSSGLGALDVRLSEWCWPFLVWQI
jgi:hypothetical protein